MCRHSTNIENSSNNLNVYKLCNATKRSVERGRKWARQRAKRGFCEYDVWEMFSWFVDIISDMLREFKKQHQGVPASLCFDEYEKNAKDYPHILHKEDLMVVSAYDEQKNEERKRIDKIAEERWEAILDEMADNFARLKTMIEDNSDEAELNAQRDKSFKLFSEWFFHLWC